MQLQDVKEGQQYYRIGGPATVWQVRGVSGDPNGIRHAQLFNVERPRELKTLTCWVLCDSTRYRLLAEKPDDGAAAGVQRRT